MTAEQWLSARQSVRAFAQLGHSEWTTRHGFFADMGGILVAPKDCRPFPVDGQQLAYLVKNKLVTMPNISVDDLKAMDKADRLARFVTLIQMGWYCLNSIARGIQQLGFCTLEVTTLAFILCTLHTFFFWYNKPLDPATQRTIPMEADAKVTWQPLSVQTSAMSKPYTVTPLDFVKPKPDTKSLITPFWFGFNHVLGHVYGVTEGPAPTLPNSRILPQDGVTATLSAFNLLFQFLYYGLYIGFAWIAAYPSNVEWYMWVAANAANIGLIGLYVLAIPIGTYFAPSFGRRVLNIEATTVLDIGAALPQWIKHLMYGPFVLGYIIARSAVLVESIISLRALPAVVYQEVDWSAFLPHL
ncbi:MAG: hypothetical protein M1821_009051 [Bathelium mastoideum]|nr:MAG: hypothetical protein M1821_009051 [Bathelium mastoideum]